MIESIHGERTASEPQDRVTELIEQQTAISEVLRAIASSPHDSSTPSSTAPHVHAQTPLLRGGFQTKAHMQRRRTAEAAD
jgi:C4-dicarboxylate-specific signal transduction histidine kinase